MLNNIFGIFVRSPHSLKKAIVIISLFILPSITQASDVDDVMKVVQSWADLESDLEAQAKLVRDDRVQVGNGIRQTDQKKNLQVQLLNHKAMVSEQGGEPEMIVRVESPLVRVYGKTAVVSFTRLFNIVPHNKPARPVGAAWFTMVLVKENNRWGIAHHHVSPIDID